MRLAALFALVVVTAAAIPLSVLFLREETPAPASAVPTTNGTPGLDGRSPFTVAALRNLAITTESAPGRSVQLANGVATLAAPDGATLDFRLSDLFAYGNLDDTGQDDAAVVLIVTRNRRPEAIQVAAVLNSRPPATASASLPSGALVRGLSIESGEVIVQYRDTGAALERERRYTLVAGELRLQSEADAPPGSLDAAFAYAIERVEVPSGGEIVLSRTLPPGVGADFVISLGQGQGYSLWAQSQFSNAILSVFGTRDQRTVVSRNDYVSQYTGVSPVAQDYVVRVINVGGAELPFRLTITAPGGTPGGGPSTAVSLPPTEPPPGGFTRPSGQLPLAALSPAAAAALEGREGRVGAAVLRLSDGALFTAGTGEPLELVSAVKVPLMVAIMARAESEGGALQPHELDLLWPMVTFSDNDSATLLWRLLGSESGFAAWIESAGIAGFDPAPFDEWGATTATPAAMAVLLARLYSGDLLTPEHRDLALAMLNGVIDGQRWGVSAGVEAAGAAYVLKNGWFPESDGWQVVSAGIVLPDDPANAYAIAILTDRQPSLEYGIETIESAAAAIAQSLLAP